MYSMRMGASAFANHVHLNAVSYAHFYVHIDVTNILNSDAEYNCEIQ
jgi:hypothetical protein